MSKTPTRSTKPDEVDWDAAISGAVVKAVTQSRANNRRRQPKKASEKPVKARDVHNYREPDYNQSKNNQIIPNDVVSYDYSSTGYGDNKAETSLLNAQELAFLSAYLKGGISIDKAMISAGYAHFSQQHRYEIARKVVKAYARGTEDRANILRDIGLSEVEVAHSLKQMIDSARSEQVKLNALALAAKCLRLTDEPVSTHQGVSIHIHYGQQQGGQQGSAPERQPSVHVNTQINTTKAIQITR
jgi:hypothetical protein